MSTLVVNCRRFSFRSTLGVSHALMRLSGALAADHQLVFVVDDAAAVADSPVANQIRAMGCRVITSEAALREHSLRFEAIEISPHHFQAAEFCSRSILICHDLHIFDVPWKYGDRAVSMQAKLRRNLVKASAVVTHFPRTYYMLEQIAGVTVMNLFLTDSPLLMDTGSLAVGPPDRNEYHGFKRLLYPAQLQAHKNHEALIRAVMQARERGWNLTVSCPGSEHRPALTEKLREMIREAGVEESIHLLGRVPDDVLMDLYRRCDGVIVPSLAEGGAYVALEAIAAGKPVAVNRIDSAIMHLDSMEAEVIWFDSSDPQDTLRGLEDLLRADAVDWYKRNDRCRRRLAELTWDDVAATWNSIIEMVEGSRGRPILRTDPNNRRIAYV